ncbi:MAG TPA: hypothetical protein VFT35_12675 [Gaiellaceae bacterium]|nr:hypothetical protein [Gaiellaceae bacterium]
MADDVMDKAAADTNTVSTNGVGATVAKRPESRADRARQLAYRNRFAAFFVVLAVVAGAGVGSLLVLVGRGSPEAAPAWSAWEPTGTTDQRVAQIADHVSRGYRLPSGNALVAVTYQGLPVGTLDGVTPGPVRAIAVRPDTTGGRADASDITTFDARNTVQYELCGLGKNCSIAEGKASDARGQLLRREALELALYSLQYAGGIESTLVLLPRRADGNEATAIFLTRDDVRNELAAPLDQTLTAPLTPGVGEITADEQAVLNRTVEPRLYEYGWLQAQDGTLVMVLSPTLGG